MDKKMDIYTHVYIYICMCIYIHIYTHIYTHTYVCVCVCVCVFSQVVIGIKNLPVNAGDKGDARDMGSIPGLGKSGGNPLQYSSL